MIPITIVIPVKNEEKNLPKCLQIVEEFSQIVVVDSNSTDRTPEIAKNFGAEYVNFNWNGKFPKKRNWILENHSFKNKWVLFLDADEFLTLDFITEMKQKIKQSQVNGFWVNFTNHFMGSPLNYGDKFKKLPLFRIGTGAYEKIQEDSWSHLDMEVHEHPIIEGAIGEIKNPVIHDDYRGLEHYISKHNAYSSWEAKRYLALKGSNSLDQLNFRQRVKYKLIGIGAMPVIYFIGSYLLKLGFLDGKAGFRFAVFKSTYFFQIQSKIVEFGKTYKL